MHKILFLCHGNICRSPMAEFVFKDIVKRRGLDDKYEISSSALTYDEIGNDMYFLAKSTLDKNNIPYTKRQAKLFNKHEYEYYDLIIIMDDENQYLIDHIIKDTEHKVHRLLEYCNLKRDVLDPWYTRRFDDAYADIKMGCTALFDFLNNTNK